MGVVTLLFVRNGQACTRLHVAQKSQWNEEVTRSIKLNGQE